ncbi:MAG TPA: hypothetical protein DHW22_08945 [Planctomycetaceae bacterium]|nr:hypothetical protein [Planctomycetaceae bacterium]
MALLFQKSMLVGKLLVRENEQNAILEKTAAKVLPHIFPRHLVTPINRVHALDTWILQHLDPNKNPAGSIAGCIRKPCKELSLWQLRVQPNLQTNFLKRDSFAIQNN